MSNENKITQFPVLQPLALQSDGSFSPQGTGGGVGNAGDKGGGFARQFTGDLYSSRARFGNGTNYWDISATEMKTANFVSGSAGCRIGYDGNVEFNDGNFRGDITGASGTFSGTITATTGSIGGFTIGSNYIRDAANTFGLSSTITGGDDVRFWAGDTFANRATAPFRVTEAGGVTASNLTITGGSVATSVLSGLIAQGNLNVAQRGWTQTSAFSVTDADTIAWGAGTFTASDGTAYSITAGNTGNMAAKTYIYLDTAVSTTAYQTTTTSTTAVGAGKVLIAIAQNGTSEATYMVMQGQGGQNIDAANIVAGSITANEIAASTITAGLLNVATLSAITANLGTITAGEITGITITGGTFQTASSGQRITINASDNYIKIFDANGQIGALGGSTDGTNRYLDLTTLDTVDVNVVRVLAQHTTGTQEVVTFYSKGYQIVAHLRNENTNAARTAPVLYIGNLGYGGLISGATASADTYPAFKISHAGSGNAYELFDPFNSVTSYTVAKDGTTTIGNLTAPGKKYLYIKGDDDSDNDPGILVLYAHNGTPYYIWVDNTGDLRIHTSAPTDEDVNGTVVGTQS